MIAPIEIENKENDDVVQNEQTADTGSYPSCVMVDGVIYMSSSLEEETLFYRRYLLSRRTVLPV
mgnify:CR=1 FL=1